MSPKIQAVRDNVSPDFVIVFRTCANLYGYGIDEAIRRMEGIRCGFKSTSCPDQLATALKQYKAQN